MLKKAVTNVFISLTWVPCRVSVFARVWSWGVVKYPNIMRCRYNAINFLQNPHNSSSVSFNSDIYYLIGSLLCGMHCPILFHRVTPVHGCILPAINARYYKFYPRYAQYAGKISCRLHEFQAWTASVLCCVCVCYVISCYIESFLL